MGDLEEVRRRFNEIKSRLESIHLQLQLLPEDGTAVVDLGDLDWKCRRLQEAVDGFLKLPPEPGINEELGERLIRISVSTEELTMCCRDLKGPLERMVSAVYESLGRADDIT